MKQIPLSNGDFAVVDDDAFEKAKHLSWHQDSHGYPRAYVPSTGYGKKDWHKINLHALVMGNVPEGLVTDHINGNTLDNRRENLRFCSWTLSNLNKSNKHGVAWIEKKKKWRICTTVAGKKFHGGYFDTEEEARSVAALLHGALIYYELTKGSSHE